jgi:hypothetical protein
MSHADTLESSCGIGTDRPFRRRSGIGLQGAMIGLGGAIGTDAMIGFLTQITKRLTEIENPEAIETRPA